MPAGIKIDGISFSELALVDRPEHAAVLGRIFTSWSLIESSITALLGLMMHGDHRTALAVLESFKSNHSRVQAVRKIGNQVLDVTLRDDFDALMKDVLSYAQERNAIAHSLWGSHKDQPEIVYRMPMTALSARMIELPNKGAVDADQLVATLNEGITSLSVADLQGLEQNGRDLLHRVMSEATKKAYSRTLENHFGKA
ncbi:hypothetical protein [Paraburkholderia tropica]|uniref:hypothetical protein n=1 Tax=Paraburkholderia tropica TaxID=92647 RepID=UPI003D26647D